MNKVIWAGIFLVATVSNIFSQEHSKGFEVIVPQQKVQNSLYRSISFLDSRKDTSTLGYLRTGVKDVKTNMVFEIPFALQLSNLMKTVTDQNAKDGELLFQLRDFRFKEDSKGIGVNGYCSVRAELYSKDKEQYRVIGSLDTLIDIKALDATKALINNASKVITNLIVNNLTTNNNLTEYYSLNSILKIDSVEKKRLKVYNVTNYTDGIYKNYKEFSNQVPSGNIVELKMKKTISWIKTLDNKGKITKVNPAKIYAIVYQGIPYITTEYGYYPMKRENNNLTFIGKVYLTPDMSSVMTATMMFGGVGAIMMSYSTGVFEIEIDHKTGKFKFIKEIKA